MRIVVCIKPVCLVVLQPLMSRRGVLRVGEASKFPGRRFRISWAGNVGEPASRCSAGLQFRGVFWSNGAGCMLELYVPFQRTTCARLLSVRLSSLNSSFCSAVVRRRCESNRNAIFKFTFFYMQFSYINVIGLNDRTNSTGSIFYVFRILTFSCFNLGTKFIIGPRGLWRFRPAMFYRLIGLY